MQVLFAVVVATSLVVVIQQRLRPEPRLSQPARDQTEPVSTRFRKANDIRLGGQPIFAVAVGNTGGKDWGVVGFGSKGGKWCAQETGYFANGGFGCSRAFRSEDGAVQPLGGSERDGRFLEMGLTTLDVKRVFNFAADGRSWSAPAVRPGSAMFRVYAIERPGGDDVPATAWTDDRGLHRLTYAQDTRPLCPAVVPRTGSADALPMVGQTTRVHVNAVANQREADLLARYSATALNVESRDGQVWKKSASGRVTVLEAGDYQLTLFVPTAKQCPAQPQTIDGVPIAFVIGERPPAAQVVPAKNPHLPRG